MYWFHIEQTPLHHISYPLRAGAEVEHGVEDGGPTVNVEDLQTQARLIFSVSLLERVTTLINALRRNESLATYGFSKSEKGPGCKAFYAKGGRRITLDEHGAGVNVGKRDDAFLYIFGGQYRDRVDVDFRFRAYRTVREKGIARKQTIRFGFWLVSSASDPSKLVLRVHTTDDAMMPYAVGAVLAVLTNKLKAGRNLVGVSKEYNRHIREMFLEFGTFDVPWSQDLEIADLKLSVSSQALVAAIVPPLKTPLQIDVKSFRIYGNAIKQNANRMNTKIKNLDGEKHTAVKITHPPVNLRMELERLGVPKNTSGVWAHRIQKVVNWMRAHL
jgi:hypothetical protein